MYVISGLFNLFSTKYTTSATPDWNKKYIEHKKRKEDQVKIWQIITLRKKKVKKEVFCSSLNKQNVVEVFSLDLEI